MIRLAPSLALSFVLAAAAGGALAQPRPSTTAMPCHVAAGLVASQGAVVLSTGPRTYDRFVSSHYFCQYEEAIEPMWVPTADAAQCFIGYRCKPHQPLFDFFRR